MFYNNKYNIHYRDGDIYAALRDCQNALRLDLNHLKAHFRLAKCLNELSWSMEAFECLKQFKSKFPDYATSRACEQLDKDIRAALFAKTESSKFNMQAVTKSLSFLCLVKISSVHKCM